MSACVLRLVVIAKSCNLQQLEWPWLIVKQSMCTHKHHRAYVRHQLEAEHTGGKQFCNSTESIFSSRSELIASSPQS